MKSSFHRPLLFVWMETSPPPPSTTSAPLVQNTISVVGTWRLSSSDNGLVWIWWVWILRQCNPDCVTVWFEPTDSYKARKPFLSDAWKSLSYTSPNLAELCTIHKTLGFPTPEGKRRCLFFQSLIGEQWWYLYEKAVKVSFVWLVPVLPNALDEVLAIAVALSRPLLEHIHCLIVTLGVHGILVCGEHDGGSINLQPRKQKRVRMS